MSYSRSQPESLAEFERRTQARRAGVPFLVLRDDEGRQRLISLHADVDEVVIGRGLEHGVSLDWDPQVSRVHALLQRVGGSWTLVDDGLSRNGSYVDGLRVDGRQRLGDRAVIRCGSVEIEFSDPSARPAQETHQAAERTAATRVSPAQHRVLVALCRPMRGAPYAAPATNKAIAAELSLSVEAVKTHLRHLAEVLEVDGLPQNQKRAKLAETALTTGVVAWRELD